MRSIYEDNHASTLAARNAKGMIASSRLRVSVQRVYVVVATIAYTLAFQSAYRDLVAPEQGFWGAGYQALSLFYLILIYTACILPSLWMPVKFRRPSQLLFYIQYYFVFIPSAFLVFYVSQPRLSIDEAMVLLFWMVLGMTVLQAGYQLPLARFGQFRISPVFFWSTLACLGIGLSAYVVAILHGNFQFVGFGQIYDVRASLTDLVAASGNWLIGYALSWLENLLLPLAFATGMFGHRRWLAVAALFGYLFIFGVSGQKVALLAVFYLPAFYWLLRPRRLNPAAAMGFAFAILLVSGYVVVAWLPFVVSTIYIGLIHFRVFTIQAINFVQYYVFFKTHPVTYLSHLAGIRWFVQYPYPLDMPHTLGYYYYDVPVDNNAGMWATDAIGGLGAWSIPLISGAAAGIFWLLDSCARLFNPRFVALIIAYSGATFANVSLGTTFITGGLGLLCIVLCCLPRSGRFAQYYVRSKLISDNASMSTPTPL